MSKNTYSECISIDRGISEVFAHTLDFSKYHLWSGSLNSGFVTKNFEVVGTTFFEEYNLRGRVQRADGVVTDFEKNKHWSFKLNLAGYSLEGTYEFESLSDTKTKVTATISLIIDNALQMMMLFRLISHLFAKRQLSKNMKDLKLLLET